MQSIQLNFFIFIFLMFTLLLITAYAFIISWMYFSRWFKDVCLFVDAQNRWQLVYANVRGMDEIEFKGGTYMTKGVIPPLNKSGKALYRFSIGNPNPESLSHNPAEQINSQTISSIINNKIVQVLMSIQNTFMNLQYIMLGASIVGALASVLTALKVFGILK